MISTLSANLTRLGFDLSLAFLAADNSADFRLELWGLQIITLVINIKEKKCVNKKLFMFIHSVKNNVGYVLKLIKIRKFWLDLCWCVAAAPGMMSDD